MDNKFKQFTPYFKLKSKMSDIDDLMDEDVSYYKNDRSYGTSKEKFQGFNANKKYANDQDEMFKIANSAPVFDGENDYYIKDRYEEEEDEDDDFEEDEEENYIDLYDNQSSLGFSEDHLY